MLAALVEIRNLASMGNSINLHCFHVEHGIRSKAESTGDAEFVRSLCKKFKVPCSIFHVKSGKIKEAAKERGIGIQAAARLYRRKAWRKKIRELKFGSTGQPHSDSVPVKVLIAHTADDLLETVLMRVLRGSGPSGLAAMPSEKGCILRPLISLSRCDVLAHLSEKKIPWREDASNTDTKYLRNRIRHRLIPILDDNFPSWRNSIASLAKTQSLSAGFIQNEAKRLVPWQREADELRSPVAGFFAQPLIIREEALFQGINLLKISRSVKRSNIRHFSKGRLKALDLGHLRIFEKDGQIVLSPLNNDYEYGFSLLIKARGSYSIKSMAISVQERSVDKACGENDFFSLLPFVVKPSLKKERDVVKNNAAVSENSGEIFSAVDSAGLAALVSMTGLIWRREILDKNCCKVTVTGV